MANSMDPDQTAPIGAVCSGSTLFVLNLIRQYTLPIQCRHIEHMHEGVWFRKNNF